MQIAPYLYYQGNCAEAFRFYSQALGGNILQLQTFAQSPIAANVPPAWHSKILQARLQIGKVILRGSDSPDGQYERPQGFSVALTYENAAQVDPAFTALAQGGKITLALCKTFWSPRFGMLTDAFGVPWIVSAEDTV